jgi:diguanylate cyclase (GGDEF)-like protein
MSLIAGLREKRSVGELSTELRVMRERSILLGETAAALITCVKALALDIPDIGAPALKTDLDTLADRIAGQAEPEVVSAQLHRSRRETIQFAERERVYLEQRENELRRIIEVLTEGLTELSAGNANHHKRVLENGARFEAAGRLGDLVSIRRAIATEVTGLRKTVSEKQAEDAAHTASLRREVESLRKDIEDVRSKAATDPLTGAANRAAFDADLARRCDRARAGTEGFAMLLLDVDHFKKINDTYGHQTGDRVLVALVGYCRGHVRGGDLLARWGGEEFALVLPSANLKAGLRKAQDLVKGLAKRTWAVDSGATIGFTMSVGVAAWQDGDDPETIMARADRALYQAKHEGRNRAVAEKA